MRHLMLKKDLFVWVVVFAAVALASVSPLSALAVQDSVAEKSLTGNIVFYEGFENGLQPTWRQIYISSPDGFHANWNVRKGAGIVAPPSTLGVPDTAAVGLKNAVFQWQGVGHVTRLITPPINLEFVVNPVLTFFHSQAEWDAGEFDKLNIYYRLGETGPLKFLRGYNFAVDQWTDRSISLTDHESGEFYLILEGVSGWGSGICIDEFTITETGVVTKELNNFTTSQASVNFIPSGGINNLMLKSVIRVTGNTGSLKLNSYTAASLNTSDVDISSIKLYYTTSEAFSNAQLVGQATGFQNGLVTFDSIDMELPTGYSYLWLSYDVKEDAVHGNYADAYIPAGGIVVNGVGYPAAQQSPPGQRVIYESVFYDDFDTDKGWELTGEWEIDIPKGLGGYALLGADGSSGHPDASNAFVGTKILGTDITGLGTTLGNYEPGLTGLDYTATSPEIDCFYYKDVTLSFHRWLNVEPEDKVWIHISEDGGETWTQVWVNENFFNTLGWTQLTYTLKQGNRKKRLKIRFGLGPTDSTNNYSGWNIDNLVVTGTFVTQDAGIAAWLSSDKGCGMSNQETVVAEVANFGAADINAPVPLGYSLDAGATWFMDTLFGGIPVGGKVAHTFKTKADFSVAGKYDKIVVKTFWAEDQDNSNDTLHHTVFSVPYITPPYSEMFVNSDGLWAGYGDNSSWQWASPSGNEISTAYAGDKAWFTNAAGAYNTMEASWLESPCFNLTGVEYPVIEFFLNRNTQPDIDGVGIQYSTDEGKTWNNVIRPSESLSWNWYSELSSVSMLQQAWSTSYGWHGDSDKWERVRAVLGSEIANKNNVKFRLVFASDDTQADAFEGIGFDAFSLFNAPHDVGVSALANPSGGCGLTEKQAVTVTIKNYSLKTLPSGTQVPVGLEVDQLPGAYEFLKLENDLPAGETVNYTFTSLFDLSGTGEHQIVAYTMLPGDSDFYNPGVYNDTLTVSFSVYELPPFSLGEDIYTTMADTLVLDAGTGFTSYLWNTGSTTPTYAVTSLHSQYYSATVTDANGCEVTDSVFVDTRDIRVTAVLNPQNSCTLSDKEVVSVQVENAGIDSYEAGTIIPVQLFYNNNLYDESQIILQTKWMPGERKNVTFQKTFDLSAAGNYNIRIAHQLRDAEPSNNFKDHTITVYGLPQSALADTLYSTSPTGITLDGGEGFVSYLWQNGSTGRYFTPDNALTAWYYVTLTDTNGCAGKDSVLVVTYDIGVAEIKLPVETCELSDNQQVSVELMNNGPDTLAQGMVIPLLLEFDGARVSREDLVTADTWLPGQPLNFTFQSTVDLHHGGVYLVKVIKAHGDVNTANNAVELAVTIHGYPDIYLPVYIATNHPEQVVLKPGEGYHAYLWNDGSTLSTFQVQTWGEHWVKVSNSFGCTSEEVTTIYPEVFDLAIDTILSPTSVCSGTEQNQVIVRYANSGYVPISAGTIISFSYKINDENIISESLILPEPLLPFTTVDFTFNTPFLAVSGINTVWAGVSFGQDEIADNNALQQDFNTTSMTTVSLGDDIVTIDPAGIVLSPGDQFTSYVWNDGSTLPYYQVTFGSSATYSVVVTDSNGCTGEASVDVITYNLSVDELVSPRSFCMFTSEEIIEVDIYNDSNENFTEGKVFMLGYEIAETPGMITENFTLTQPWPANSNYRFRFQQRADLSRLNKYLISIYILSPNLEPETDMLSVNIELTGVPQVSLGPDIYTNRPDTVVLNAGAGFEAYQWHNGFSEQLLPVTSYGWKWVTVTNSNGCLGADTLYVGFFNSINADRISFSSRVYPNPSNGKVFIELENLPDAGVTIDILDANGRLVIREKVAWMGNMKHEKEISNLQPGVYFINITGSERRFAHKITIIP